MYLQIRHVTGQLHGEDYSKAIICQFQLQLTITSKQPITESKTSKTAKIMNGDV